MQSNDIIEVLENDEAKSFMAENLTTDSALLMLKYSGAVNFNLRVCLNLMDVYKKSTAKLPFLFDSFLAVTQKAYEQATSYAVARYKSSFIRGGNLLDITGGLGIDSIVFSAVFETVTAVERDHELHALALYNVRKLGIENLERIKGNGEDHLQLNLDWIYIDPDRRVTGARGVTISSMSPDISSLIPTISTKTKCAYVKLSPLFDIQEVWRNFEQTETVHVIAEKGEIKEVGMVLNFELTSPVIQRIILCDVHTDFLITLERGSSDNVAPRGFSNFKEKYMLVPNSLVLKSNSAEVLLRDISVTRHDTFQYYFSNHELEVTGFRKFRVLAVSTLSSKGIKNVLRSNGVDQINIVIRGLSDQPEKWHKKLGTRDGGNFYLFVFKSKKSDALLCQFIS